TPSRTTVDSERLPSRSLAAAPATRDRETRRLRASAHSEGRSARDPGCRRPVRQPSPRHRTLSLESTSLGTTTAPSCIFSTRESSPVLLIEQDVSTGSTGAPLL